MKDLDFESREELASEIHLVYQCEAQRQRSGYWPNDYKDIDEDAKEYDRVLVDWHYGKLFATVAAEREPRDAYIKFLEDALKGAEAFLSVHGCNVSQEDVDKGERMRAAIRRGPEPEKP